MTHSGTRQAAKEMVAFMRSAFERAFSRSLRQNSRTGHAIEPPSRTRKLKDTGEIVAGVDGILDKRSYQ